MIEAYLILFLLPVAFLCLIIVIPTWRRWNWRVQDAVALATPGAIWLLLVASRGGSGRSLANLVELPILAALTALLALAKGPLERRAHRAIRTYVLPVVSLLLPLIVYFLFPVLEE